MTGDDTDWIDPVSARVLMLEYRKALGVKGASAIERQIDRHAKLGISRKTIENWLNNSESVVSAQTLGIILKFLKTAHFQAVVPRAKDYVDSDARLARIGTALSDLYGLFPPSLYTLEKSQGSSILKNTNNKIAGWWMAEKVFNQNSLGSNYLHISPVTDHPFCKVHAFVRSNAVPIGSGLIFPDRIGGPINEFAARIYSKERYFRELSCALYFEDWTRSDVLRLSVHVRDDDDSSLFATLLFQFARANEDCVPNFVRNAFDDWNRDVLPRDLRSLREGSYNEDWGQIGAHEELFRETNKRDDAIEEAQESLSPITILNDGRILHG